MSNDRMTHPSLWLAIDLLAARNKMTTSGLARHAGLDPTAFNPSKRVSKHGRWSWPSSETVARILAATDTSPETFVRLLRKAQKELLLVDRGSGN